MDHKNITAKHFFESWVRNTNSLNDKLCENWSNRKTYTSLVQNDKDCVLQNIANDFNLSYFREYYSLDAVFYNDDDKVPGLNSSWVWLRKIRIAFEHEHDFRNTYQEVSHLAITTCDLRVLVTYPNCNDLSVKDKLDYFTEIIKYNQAIKDGGNFLLIFGRLNEAENDIFWKGLVYNGLYWQLVDSPSTALGVTVFGGDS